MVVACLALLAALGGTSIAAVNQLVPRNSVGAAQLQFGAVTNPKIRDNAVNSAKVANRSLRGPISPWASSPPGPRARRGHQGHQAPRVPRVPPARRARSERSRSARSPSRSRGGIAENAAANTAEVQSICAGNERDLGRHGMERQQPRSRALDGPAHADPQRLEPGGRLPGHGRKRQRASEVRSSCIRSATRPERCSAFGAETFTPCDVSAPTLARVLARAVTMLSSASSRGRWRSKLICNPEFLASRSRARGPCARRPSTGSGVASSRLRSSGR